MDKELQEYYDERFSMTASKGWQDLMEDVSTMKDTVQDILNAKDGEHLAFRKGQLDIIMWLMNLRTQAETTYETHTDESV